MKLSFSGSALFHMKTRVCIKYFIRDCILIVFYPFNSPQIPLNLNCLKSLGTLKPLTLRQFQPKIRATILQTSGKIFLA